MKTSRISLTSHWFIVILAALLLPTVFRVQPAHAQGNLLQNSAFDGAYTGRGGISGGVPDGWSTWGSFQNSDHESLGVLVHSAPYSWRFRTESGLPTGGGYQTVAAQNGASYRFSIYALIWTCNDEQYQCRDDTHTFADTTSGGRLRIGIDPAGGTDPYSGNVVWSGFASPFNWGSLSPLAVEATARSSQITVFTYYTADVAMRWHDVFWDDATLVATSGSGGTSGGNTGQPQATAEPQPTAVPIVVAPQPRPDGSAVHLVQAGQTLWGISLAYNVPLENLRAMNHMSGSTIYVGQQLVVQAAPATPAPPAPMVIVVTSTPAVAAYQPAQASALVAFQPSATPSVSQPSPTPVTQQVVNVRSVNQPPASVSQQPGGADSGPRTLILLMAGGVLLGAVGATGGLAGYIAYKVVRV